MAFAQEGNKLVRLARGRQAGLSRANNGQRFVGRKMRQRFLKRSGEIRETSSGREPQNGLAETVDAVGSGSKSFGCGIILTPGDDYLQRLPCEKRGCQAIRRGKHPILRRDAGKRFEGFLRKVVIALIAGEGMHAKQGNGRGGIRSRRRRILKRLAANVEAAQGGGVRRPVEKASPC